MVSSVHFGHVARQGPYTFGKLFMMQRIVFGGKARQLYSKCLLQLTASSKCNICFSLHHTHLFTHPVCQSFLCFVLSFSFSLFLPCFLPSSLPPFLPSFLPSFFLSLVNKCFPDSLFLSCTRWKSYC